MGIRKIRRLWLLLTLYIPSPTSTRPYDYENMFFSKKWLSGLVIKTNSSQKGKSGEISLELLETRALALSYHNKNGREDKR